MNKITERVAMEVAFDEGLVRQTYYDSVGVPTWSIGITSNSGHNVDRYWDKPQPLQRCIEVFVWALQKYADRVTKAFAGHELTEAQFAAALKFDYNTGDIDTATWVKRWKSGDIAGAREAFMWYNKPAEIVARRTRERDLFFDGKWSSNGSVAEYTRLTSGKTPVWSSAVRVDIRPALAAIFNSAPATETAPPQSDNTAKVIFGVVVAAIAAAAAAYGINIKELLP